MAALTLRLLTLLFAVSFCSAIRDRQLFSGGTGTPATYTTSDVTVVDRDNNGVKPSADLLSNSILLRMETMPADNDVNAMDIHENNLVFFPFIANPAGNEMVELRLTYNHNMECPSYIGVHPAVVQCKDYFKIMLVPMSANTDVNILTVADLNTMAVRVVTLTPGAGNTAQDISVDEIFNFPASTEGYRVVVHDEGSSFTLKHKTVDRFYCSHNVKSNQLRLTCPDNHATDAKNTTVTSVANKVNTIPDCVKHIEAITSNTSGVAALDISLGGFQQNIKLPAGEYNIHISGNGLKCNQKLTIKDHRLVRRVEFTSTYPVKCVLLRNKIVESTLETIATSKFNQIREICQNDCKPVDGSKVRLECTDDKLIVTWPTNLSFDATMTEIPTQIKQALTKRLVEESKHPILDLVIFTLSPPVVYPLRSVSGAYADLVLSTSCLDNKHYNIGTDTCI